MEYALSAVGDYDTLLKAVEFAQRRHLVALAVADHYLFSVSEEETEQVPALDAFVQLGGLARDTKDIDLVIQVSPITFRHPAVLAKMAVTLDQMSGGRFVLGIGTGWLQREHEVFGLDLPPLAERFEMFEDALAYISAAFNAANPGYNGQHFQLEPFPVMPKPINGLPLLVGGTGAYKTPRLAGIYADEFNVYPGADMADRIARFRSAATDAGRDPDSIRVSSSGQVVAATNEREFEDIMNARAEAGGVSRDELDAYFEARQTPRGTFEQVRAELDHFERLGVSRFYFQNFFNPDDVGTLFDGLGVG